MTKQTVTLTEIAEMLQHFPQQKTHPCLECPQEKSFLKHMADHVKAWQVNDKDKVKLSRVRLCLYASSHGIYENSVLETQQELSLIASGKTIFNQLCSLIDSELRVYELDVENPTHDGRVKSAMNEEDAARAITYGMMAVEPGIDLIVMQSVSAGAENSAQIVHKGLHGKLSALEVLKQYGGYDFCAMLGTAIACRMAGIPIFIDRLEGQIIKDILDQMQTGAGDHLYVVEPQKEMGFHQYQSLTLIPNLKAYLMMHNKETCHVQQNCQSAIA